MRRVPLSRLSAGRHTLPDGASRYVARVLRLRVGDAFEAFDPLEGKVALGRVAAIGSEVIVELDEARVERDALAPLVLVQGHPKGEKLAAIVRDATELGATSIVPAICDRSIARPDESRAAARGDRLTAVAAEAARQCGRTRAPEIVPPIAFDEALELAAAQTAARFVLWERATVPLANDLLSADPSAGVSFVIGPEGGLTEREVARAEALGFRARSLGKIVLRTETAATAVLAAYRVLTARA